MKYKTRITYNLNKISFYLGSTEDLGHIFKIELVQTNLWPTYPQSILKRFFLITLPDFLILFFEIRAETLHTFPFLPPPSWFLVRFDLGITGKVETWFFGFLYTKIVILLCESPKVYP